jgi:Autophagocytosis associated protein, active-site domain
MECNNYSYKQFDEDSHDFFTISSAIHDGWEQILTETIKYLHKTETIEILNQEKYETLNNDDLACCEIESKSLFRIDYSIIYNESFNTPMLYFNFYKEGKNII